MKKRLRYTFSALFGTHNLTDMPLRELQLPTHLSKLTTNE